MSDELPEYLADALEMISHESVPIQGKLDGFTPIFDEIAEPHGIIRAAVFGKVWRYCQMKDGVCRASVDSIADGLGINRSTALRHLNALCADGYLKDLTPDLRNKPHIYVNTGKIKVRVSVTVAESNTAPKLLHRATPLLQKATPTVAQSNMSIDIKRDKKKDIDETDTRQLPSKPRDELFDAIAEVCQVDPKTAGGTIGKVKATLSKAGYTAADVAAFGKWWWGWKDRKAPPRVWDVQERIGIVKANGKAGNRPPDPRPRPKPKVLP